MPKLFLGLDSSTQSLSAVLIDYDAQKVVCEKSLNFDHTLPQYRTHNGVLPNPDPLVKHSSPLMWAEALDLLLTQMQRDGVALRDVLAVSGSGQQHGSVYLNQRGVQAVSDPGNASSLTGLLRDGFSRTTSPIWMDSSTAAECAEIRSKLGGVKGTAQKTGSDAFERFTGPQIRRFAKTEPEDYARTESIALVSSFMASLLAGKVAAIDHGDGAGMNLMDIHAKQWHPDAIAATVPNLQAKLPSLAPSSTIVGKISPYLVNKYGFNPDALAQVWSGDNPCSVIGLGLIAEGNVAISMGTSDTYFGSMKRCRTDDHGEGHVFGSPTGDYMTLICFKNGSLAREKVRELYGIRTWDDFGKALVATTPGNDGAILLPWFEAEIVPRVNVSGVHRIDLDETDAAANCRAIVEAQMMSMRLHSQWMNVVPGRVYATGGASNNIALLQVMADVMNCPVRRIEVSKSAALGAALRAAHGWQIETGGKADWSKVVAGFTTPVPDSEVRPNAAAARVYDKLIEKYSRCEREALAMIRQPATAH